MYRGRKRENLFSATAFKKKTIVLQVYNTYLSVKRIVPKRKEEVKTPSVYKINEKYKNKK